MHFLISKCKIKTQSVGHYYETRGFAKIGIEDVNGACADWKKAASLGQTEASKMVAEYCN